MSEPVIDERWRALVPGRRYRITIDDCCVQGEFVGTFERFAVSPDQDGTPFVDGLVFDVGQLGPEWGAFTVTADDAGMTDPLRARAEAAVRDFRATGNRDVLVVLRQDGLRDIAHALLMERVYADDPDKRAEHTAVVDAWLGPDVQE